MVYAVAVREPVLQPHWLDDWVPTFARGWTLGPPKFVHGLGSCVVILSPVMEYGSLSST